MDILWWRKDGHILGPIEKSFSTTVVIWQDVNYIEYVLVVTPTHKISQ